MKKLIGIPILCLISMGIAQAEDNLFFVQNLPCIDGWPACLSDGGAVDVASVKDSMEQYHPASMRFGFFDLQPLPGFSPYAKMSKYNGSVVNGLGSQPEVDNTAVAEQEDKQEYKQEYKQEDKQEDKQEYNSNRREQSTSNTQPRTTQNQNTSSNTKGTQSSYSSTSTVKTTQQNIQPKEEVVSEPEVVPEPEVVSEPEVVPEPEAVTMSPEKQAGCMSLISMESAAMMGQLSDEQISCLEKRINSNEPLTEKRKVSRVLINNAQTKGDQSSWEKIVKRHLENLDQSDPNLCFAYAIYVSRKGTSYATQVIRWSDKALENKNQFSSGADFTKKVYQLYKLRTMAAQKLWLEAEATKDQEKITKYKGMTKDYSREWLDYAKASKQSIKEPFSLCVSAADKSFCDG